MSGTPLPHGLPQFGVGATEWRQLLNDAFAQLDPAHLRSGDFADRPTVGGTDTTPGLWYYAEDVRALFYDTGSAWRLVAATGRREVLGSDDAGTKTLKEYDALVDLSPATGAIDFNAGSPTYHQGLTLTVRRYGSGGSATDARVSLSVRGATHEYVLPTRYDHMTFLGTAYGWVVLHDGRAASTTAQELDVRDEADDVVQRKVVAFAAGPDGGTVSEAHGIVALDRLVHLRGSMTNGTNHVAVPSGNGPDGGIGAHLTATNLVLTATGDYSGYSGRVEVYYVV